MFMSSLDVNPSSIVGLQYHKPGPTNVYNKVSGPRAPGPPLTTTVTTKALKWNAAATIKDLYKRDYPSLPERCVVQRCISVFVLGLNAAVCLQQDLHYFHMALVSSHLEGRLSLVLYIHLQSMRTVFMRASK